MLRDNLLTVALANVASLPFRLTPRRPVEAPKKALILKPCCMSQVMLATPLVASLSEAYPEALFDWAISRWARPAISGNPRINTLIDTVGATLPDGSWDDVRDLIATLRSEKYDTCFIPSRATLLSYIAWQAGIPQRIGLNVHGRGFAHTLPVKVPNDEKNEAKVYLTLAEALGIESQPEMEFYPTDGDRTAVTERLLDEIGWQGILPLAIIHPGGGENPVRQGKDTRWPAERFALLGSRLIRKYGAHLLLVGSDQEQELAETIVGLISAPVLNFAGRMSLGELGALCEVADLYVGNDAGPTQIAAAMGCPTLAIFGPTDPAVSGPYTGIGKVRILQPDDVSKPFSWEHGPTADDALAAADGLMGLPPDHIMPDTGMRPAVPDRQPPSPR